jgi:hypothetical protein
LVTVLDEVLFDEEDFDLELEDYQWIFLLNLLSSVVPSCLCYC